LEYPGQTGPVSFWSKVAKRNTEPGWPGTHYVDFDLAPFFVECSPVFRKGIREEIEKKTEFVAASIETPVDRSEVVRNSNTAYDHGVGVTIDSSQWPCVATIWAPTMISAIEKLRELAPPKQGCCR